MKEIGLIQNLIEMLDKLDKVTCDYNIEIEERWITVTVDLGCGEGSFSFFSGAHTRSDNSPHDLYLFQKKVQDFLVENCMEGK